MLVSIVAKINVTGEVMTKMTTVALITVMLSSFAHAQDSDVSDMDDAPPAASAGGKNQKKIFVEFKDELVDGEKPMPSVDYLFQKSQFNFKKMIRLRENFIPEVKKGKENFSGVR